MSRERRHRRHRPRPVIPQKPDGGPGDAGVVSGYALLVVFALALSVAVAAGQRAHRQTVTVQAQAVAASTSFADGVSGLLNSMFDETLPADAADAMLAHPLTTTTLPGGITDASTLLAAGVPWLHPAAPDADGGGAPNPPAGAPLGLGWADQNGRSPCPSATAVVERVTEPVSCFYATVEAAAPTLDLPSQLYEARFRVVTAIGCQPGENPAEGCRRSGSFTETSTYTSDFGYQLIYGADARRIGALRRVDPTVDASDAQAAGSLFAVWVEPSNVTGPVHSNRPAIPYCGSPVFQEVTVNRATAPLGASLSDAFSVASGAQCQLTTTPRFRSATSAGGWLPAPPDSAGAAAACHADGADSSLARGAVPPGAEWLRGAVGAALASTPTADPGRSGLYHGGRVDLSTLRDGSVIYSARPLTVHGQLRRGRSATVVSAQHLTIELDLDTAAGRRLGASGRKAGDAPAVLALISGCDLRLVFTAAGGADLSGCCSWIDDSLDLRLSQVALLSPAGGLRMTPPEATVLRWQHRGVRPPADISGSVIGLFRPRLSAPSDLGGSYGGSFRLGGFGWVPRYATPRLWRYAEPPWWPATTMSGWQPDQRSG